MGGMGLKLASVLVRHLLGPPGLSVPTAGSSRTHGYTKTATSPFPTIHSIHPCLSTPLYVYTYHLCYYSSCEKIAQNPAI